MNGNDLAPAEIGIIRYLRSTDKRIIEAVYMWLFMNDTSLLFIALTHPHLKAAA